MNKDIILKKIKTSGLTIGGMPRSVREEFVEFAESEFADSYAGAFTHVWNNYKLFKIFFENIDMKLDRIANLLENQDSQEPEEKQIRMLSGKKLNLKGGKNE